MPTPIHHMTVIRYYRDGRPWDTEQVVKPAWSGVEAAEKAKNKDEQSFSDRQSEDLDEIFVQKYATCLYSKRWEQ